LVFVCRLHDHLPSVLFHDPTLVSFLAIIPLAKVNLSLDIRQAEGFNVT
jgi:hypothetical protein